MKKYVNLAGTFYNAEEVDSRLCKNCRWNQNDKVMDCELGVTRPLHFKSVDNFGCSEFEIKGN